MDYISIAEARLLVEEAYRCSFSLVPRKKILFHGTLPSGETVTLCTPQARYQASGFFWVDITEEEYATLERTDNGVLIFRLEGNLTAMVKWDELKKYLTTESMRFNQHEKNHWKLHILTDEIQVVGNKNKLAIQVFHYSK